MASSLQYTVSGAEKRAEDLRRTLASFPTRAAAGDSDAILSQFEQLSTQLKLLQERGADAVAEATLDRHFVVPSALSGLDTMLVGGLKRHIENKNLSKIDRRTIFGHWSSSLFACF